MIDLLYESILVLQEAVPSAVRLLDPRASVSVVPEKIRIVPRLVLIDVHVHPVDTDVRPQMHAQIYVVAVTGSLAVHENGIVIREVVLALLAIVDRLRESRLHHRRQQRVEISILQIALRVVDVFEELRRDDQEVSAVDIQVLAGGLVVIKHGGPPDVLGDLHVQLIRGRGCVAIDLASLHVLPKDLRPAIIVRQIVEVVLRLLPLGFEGIGHGIRIRVGDGARGLIVACHIGCNVACNMGRSVACTVC